MQQIVAQVHANIFHVWYEVRKRVMKPGNVPYNKHQSPAKAQPQLQKRQPYNGAVASMPLHDIFVYAIHLNS